MWVTSYGVKFNLRHRQFVYLHYINHYHLIKLFLLVVNSKKYARS